MVSGTDYGWLIHSPDDWQSSVDAIYFFAKYYSYADI